MGRNLARIFRHLELSLVTLFNMYSIPFVKFLNPTNFESNLRCLLSLLGSLCCMLRETPLYGVAR
jgi:hypothetical protein